MDESTRIAYSSRLAQPEKYFVTSSRKKKRNLKNEFLELLQEKQRETNKNKNFPVLF
jgi:hypothetical protein